MASIDRITADANSAYGHETFARSGFSSYWNRIKHQTDTETKTCKFSMGSPVTYFTTEKNSYT